MRHSTSGGRLLIEHCPVMLTLSLRQARSPAGIKSVEPSPPEVIIAALQADMQASPANRRHSSSVGCLLGMETSNALRLYIASTLWESARHRQGSDGLQQRGCQAAGSLAAGLSLNQTLMPVCKKARQY